MINPNRRNIIVGTLATSLLLIWSVRLLPVDYHETWQTAKQSLSSPSAPVATAPTLAHVPGAPPPPHIAHYFDQTFSANQPSGGYSYSALKAACDQTTWNEDDVYMKCGGMAAGLTSIVSQVKVCLKMAIDSGSHLVLPAMPLRDSTDLTDFNFLNGNAYHTYDEWFDDAHLRDQLARACPRMKVVHPKELEVTLPVKHEWHVRCGDAEGYHQFNSYFWVGRPYKTYFDDTMRQLRANEAQNPSGDEFKKGITLVNVDSEFLLYRITDDPTQHDLHLWNELSHLIRFRAPVRRVVDRLLAQMTRSYYGVHFRVENDTIWSSLEHQLGVDLDALDLAWKEFGVPGAPKPPVYLACGDAVQVEKFVTAGAERGWEVTHKWQLVEKDSATTSMINDLAFDFQGAIDMGIMVRSDFFLGITGSAFSHTVANLRDPTGRYRGSSFDVYEDDGARNHLAKDGNADLYACCL